MERGRRSILIVTLALLLLALTPAIALAQEFGTDTEGFIFRVNGPVTIAQGETVDTVFVVEGDVTVDGVLDGSLVVINGDAFVTGEIRDDVTVVRGTLDLGPSAEVTNVTIIRGELVRDTGAAITGSISQGDFQVSPWDWGVFWAFIWVGSTLVVLTAGVIFAAVGGRQLTAAGNTLRRDFGQTLLGTAAVWIVLPILMFMVLFTVIGIPLGVGYFMFVMPILWFLGYLVAGTQLGRVLMGRRGDDRHPYVPALLGLLILQILGIVPVLGGLVGFLAGVVGAGALIVLGWRAWRGPEPVASPVQPEMTTPKPAS